MLNIKRQNFKYVGAIMDYELENGVMLHESEWNGEEYTIDEVSYTPIQIYNENEDTWKTIGFGVK